MENKPNANIETEVKETDIEFVDRIQKQRIIDLFHQGESKKEEAVAEVIAWTERMEAWASSDPTLRRSILLEVARSDFYLAAGDTEGALECLDAASSQAGQEGHFDLQDIAEGKITALLKMSKSIETQSL